MNNNDIFTADFTASLPPPLRDDPNTLAIARVIAEQLQITARLIEKNLIYARIDDLPEEVLDILAYDLHVDWYDYSYPVKAKRDIIRQCVRVHKRLGTKFAVETALGGIHPDSEIEEWFEYGGEPFYFRVILDTTYSRAPAGPAEVIRTVNHYKRLSAHIEEIIYQCHVGLFVRTGQESHPYNSAKAGTVRAGTIPRRSTGARISAEALAVITGESGHPYSMTPAGTKPYTSTGAGIQDGALQLGTMAAGFPYEATEAGTRPYTSTGAGLHDGDFRLDTAAEGLRFSVQGAGNAAAGTRPGGSTGAALEDGAVQLETGAARYPYETPESGGVETVKNRSRTATPNGGAVSATATAEGFKFRVKRCGTSRCKS